MKKYFIALAGLAAAAMVSCTKEVATVETAGNLSFSASLEIPGEGVKAALSGTDVSFAAGDAVSVFDGTSNNKFTTEAGGATANFSGTAADAAQYLVLSPYSEDATLTSASVVRITIPEVQTATPGGVDPKALVSAGIYTGSGTVTLYNAVGLVKIVVPAGLTVKNIQIGGGKAATIGICGTFDFNANTQTLAPVGTMKTVITLVPAEGEDTIAPGTYYVAVRPKPDYDQGLVVGYVNASHQLCKRVGTTSVNINRSHILPLGSLEEGGNYPAISGNSILRTNGDEVQFTGRLKKIAGGAGTATVDDNVIKKIIFKSATIIPNAYNTSATQLSAGVSTAGCEIFGYLDGDVMYVLTEGPAFTINAASGSLFRNFAVLEEVIFDNVTTQANTSLTYAFRNCPNLKTVDFGDADLSKVTDFSYMFVNNKLETVRFGETATTAATTMQSMFSQALNLRTLYLGKNFTLAANINGMFNGTASTTTTIKDGEGHGLQCKFYSSQAVWDALNTDLNGDGVNPTTLFNKNRFFFTAVE